MRNLLYHNSLYRHNFIFSDYNYDRDGKDNHTFNHFYLASGMTLRTVKGGICNLVHFDLCW